MKRVKSQIDREMRGEREREVFELESIQLGRYLSS